jgi:hypothetical protein
VSSSKISLSSVHLLKESLVGPSLNEDSWHKIPYLFDYLAKFLNKSNSSNVEMTLPLSGRLFKPKYMVP